MFQVTKRILAPLLIVVAIAAPAASARPIDRVLLPGVAHETVSGGAQPQAAGSSLPPARIVETSSDGFNWGDAGIGAAASFMLLSLGTGALLFGRRGRERRPAATS